jgi:hypothetical protein
MPGLRPIDLITAIYAGAAFVGTSHNNGPQQPRYQGQRTPQQQKKRLLAKAAKASRKANRKHK